MKDQSSVMAELVLTPVSVLRVSKQKVKFLRKSFLKPDKRLFFALAVSEACDYNRSQSLPRKEIEILRKLASFEIHHIAPLSLGGTNSFDNLALVEPKLHKQIHRIIESQENALTNRQLRELKEAYKRNKKLTLIPKQVINIPTHVNPGTKVWGLFPHSRNNYLSLVPK